LWRKSCSKTVNSLRAPRAGARLDVFRPLRRSPSPVDRKRANETMAVIIYRAPLATRHGLRHGCDHKWLRAIGLCAPIFLAHVRWHRVVEMIIAVIDMSAIIE